MATRRRRFAQRIALEHARILCGVLRTQMAKHTQEELKIISYMSWTPTGQRGAEAALTSGPFGNYDFWRCLTMHRLFYEFVPNNGPTSTKWTKFCPKSARFNVPNCPTFPDFARFRAKIVRANIGRHRQEIGRNPVNVGPTLWPTSTDIDTSWPTSANKLRRRTLAKFGSKRKKVVKVELRWAQTEPNLP